LGGFSLARKAIFSFSYKPLEWLFWVAIGSVVFFLAGIVYYVLLYFLKPDEPRGFSTIVVIILFIGSLQLTAISILSEYLRRIFEEVKSRPVSIAKEIINDHRK
jgi:membrane protein YdbS with pleckstrin-like domain